MDDKLNGQEFSSSLLYVPLAEQVTELGKQGLSKITYDGESLWNNETNASTDLGIPQWIKDNAKWWSEGCDN